MTVVVDVLATAVESVLDEVEVVDCSIFVFFNVPASVSTAEEIVVDSVVLLLPFIGSSSSRARFEDEAEAAKIGAMLVVEVVGS